LRILFCSYYTGLGGGEVSLMGLMNGLKDRGHESVLLCPRDGQLPESARGNGIGAFIVPYRGATAWFMPKIWWYLPATQRIDRAIADLKPTAVHSDFHTLPFVSPVCGRHGIPLVYTCYGWWFRPKPWQRAFFRRGPTLTLAISEAVKTGFLGQPPFMAPDHVQTVYLGVDTQKFQPRPDLKESIRRELHLPVDAPVLSFVGRYQDVKGHDVFLKAARRIALQDPTACFAVAGENVFLGRQEENLKLRIHAEVGNDPLLRDRVRFLGWAPNVERLLICTDVFVCSSRFESFGLALVEAMACGIPVVSTNRGAPAETVLDGQTGYLTAPGRDDLIADRALRLLADEQLRRRMGEAGRSRVCQFFSLERYVSDFERLVTEISSRDG
jgi:glycosyltransferase involved in cell wall biosynthesis